MKELFIVDKNSELLLSFKEGEDSIIDESIRVSSDGEKLLIVIDGELSKGGIETDGINFYG